MLVVLFLFNDVDRNNIKIGGYLLRKKIFIIIMVLLLSFQSVCSAAELSKYLDGRAVNVTQDEDSIDIYALVSFIGDEKDDYVPNTSITYSEAFMLGVRYVWSGVYDGKCVNVHIEEVEDNTPVQKVRVLFDSVTGQYNFSHAQKAPPTIWMYTGDGRAGIDHVYDYNGILYVSGHEFGHILGLGDVYADTNEKVKQYLNSPMNGWDWRQATDADYFIMLKHNTWLHGNLFIYSSDRELLKWYLPI